VNIIDDRISVFDTGPGMDGSDENSIVKWYVVSKHVLFSNFLQDYWYMKNDVLFLLVKTESLAVLEGWMASEHEFRNHL
jgi:hypothetical protein